MEHCQWHNVTGSHVKCVLQSYNGQPYQEHYFHVQYILYPLMFEVEGNICYLFLISNITL